MKRNLSLLAFALVAGVALVYFLITRDTTRRHERLEGRLTVQQWLNELALEMAESSHRKLFPNRAELERSFVRETRRPAEGEITLSRVPVGPLSVRDLTSGADLPYLAASERVLRVAAAGAVLLTYPVDDLTLYWVEDGRFYRQRRSGQGATELTQLNPDLRVSELRFTRLSSERVRIELSAGTFRGVQEVTIR